MRSWLFNTLTVSNLMLDSMSIKNKILFEEIPDGEQYLPLILKALKKNQVLEMTYQSYWRDEPNTFEVEPYCLKAFKLRWYLVARSPYYDKIMIYSQRLSLIPKISTAKTISRIVLASSPIRMSKSRPSNSKCLQDRPTICAASPCIRPRGRSSVLTNTASSPSACAPPSISSRRSFRWVAI